MACSMCKQGRASWQILCLRTNGLRLRTRLRPCYARQRWCKPGWMTAETYNMLLMIDNYDSFTYNLVQYLGELGQDVRVYRNDEIDLVKVAELKPRYIVISPGPCTPNEAGISVPLIKQFAGKVPILGVCLGHQAIGQAMGGKIVHAKQVMHGKTSAIQHNSTSVFRSLPNPFQATRYHSLVIERVSLPDCLE